MSWSFHIWGAFKTFSLNCITVKLTLLYKNSTNMVWQKKRYVTWPNLLDDIRWGYWMNSVLSEANRWFIPYWCSHKINNWNGCDRNKMRPTCSNAFGEVNGYEILLVWMQHNWYLVSGSNGFENQNGETTGSREILVRI